MEEYERHFENDVTWHTKLLIDNVSDRFVSNPDVGNGNSKIIHFHTEKKMAKQLVIH